MSENFSPDSNDSG